MRIYNYIVFFCCFFFASCTSSYSPDFPREEILSPELMPLQGVTIPNGLEVKHPFLIVENYKRTDSIFHIYDLNNYVLKSAFGVKGRGPNEWLSPWLVRTQLSDILIERGDDVACRLSIDPDGAPIFVSAERSNYIEGIANAAFINDSLYVLDTYGSFISPGYVHLLTLKDELPRKSWKYGDPSIIYRHIDPDFGEVFANASRIVFNYNFKKQIDFMDIEFNLIKRVRFRYTPPVAITEQNQAEVKKSYTSGYLGKRYFYTLFQGTSWTEYLYDYSFRGSILEVFDLDGNPVIKYRFDGVAPDSFVIDEETFTLYGFKYYGGIPEDHLLVYQLKGLS